MCNLWRVTLRLWTPYNFYDKIGNNNSAIMEVDMAEKCICCGKKIGLLNGSHLNNQVCDNCYFPIGGYLSILRENSDIQTIEDNYSLLLDKIGSSSYSEKGKEYLIKIADDLIKSNKETIQSKLKFEQTRKDFKITTSNMFIGYNISNYYGIVSGNTVIGTGFLSEGRATVSDTFGIENDSFSDKLEQAKNSSIQKMISNAIKQGGNALIGISFDYITFSSNMIGVVANGTVVEIVKQDDNISAN